jgi:benzoate membrane transport protein
MVRSQYFTTGFMSALLACTGGAVLLVQSAENLGLSREELITWMFAVYVVGGLLNLLLSWAYKIPFGGAHSITVVAFLSSTALVLPLSELAGSFIMSGVCMVILGMSRLFSKLLTYIPKPIIDAMLAGLILKYAVNMIPALQEAPIIGGMAILGFVLTAKCFKNLPPIVGAVCLGCIGTWVTGIPAIPASEFVIPQFVAPQFTVRGFLSVTIPSLVLILSNDVAVGLTALKKNGFDPPVNRTLFLTGLSTSAAGFFGGHATSIGGMMSALCSSEEAGPQEKRYVAAMVSGLLVMVFGLFAWKMVAFIQVLPMPFIQMVTGISLLGVLLNSLKASLSTSSYKYSTLFSFIIAVSNMTFLGISSALWSLVVGVIAAKVLGEHPVKEEARNRLEGN